MSNVTQSQFIHALLEPDAPVPKGLCGPDGSEAGKRFSVYRNNVAVSLTEALGQAFPVLKRIVGDEFFDALAGVFLRSHPPSSPLMMFYGTEMPAFLSNFDPVKHLPYLADVARLEIAVRSTYHAADATPIDANILQEMAPDALMASHISFAPAVRLLTSEWPLHAIYMANTQPNAPAVTPSAQNVLLTRADYDPQVRLLPLGGAEFISELQANHNLGEAIDCAGQIPEFDLSAVLGLLLNCGAITQIGQN